MFIKMFREQVMLVPDPLKPGKRAKDMRLTPTGASGFTHLGEHYEADEGGWFDVPAEVGQFMLGFRAGDRGERYFTLDQVSDEMGSGRIIGDDIDALPGDPKQKQATQAVPPQTLKQAQAQPQRPTQPTQAKAAGSPS